jgi:hypothetical protein
MARDTLWKLRREIARLGAQLARSPWYIRSPIQKALHDLRHGALLARTDGACPLGPEIALVLLYQPDGLLSSTFHMLDHLRSKGLSLLIVSNAPLSQADRDRLRPRAWRIIERPNFGYDFGGYRDGILHLLDEGIGPARLFVINDSIWFPLGEDSDLVERARASEADLYGFSLNDLRRKTRHWHLQSYFLVFSGRLFQHEDFRRFWKRLFLSDNRDHAIRRCEIVLTEYFRIRGHKTDCRHRNRDTVVAAGAMDDAELKSVMSFLVSIEVRNAAAIDRLLSSDPSDPAWRETALWEIDPARSKAALIYAHPLVLLERLHAPILKKNRDREYVTQRAALLALGFDASFAPVIRDEIRHWDETPGPRMAQADK